MKVSLIADGTLGDIQPFLGLARSLSKSGHAVQIVTNVSHAEHVKPLAADGSVVSAVYFPVDWTDVFTNVEAIAVALAVGDEPRYMLALMDVWSRSAAVLAPIAR